MTRADEERSLCPGREPVAEGAYCPTTTTVGHCDDLHQDQPEVVNLDNAPHLPVNHALGVVDDPRIAASSNDYQQEHHLNTAREYRQPVVRRNVGGQDQAETLRSVGNNMVLDREVRRLTEGVTACLYNSLTRHRRTD
jgi:hypothetical protein